MKAIKESLLSSSSATKVAFRKSFLHIMSSAWGSFFFNMFIINPYVKKLIQTQPYGRHKTNALVACILLAVIGGTFTRTRESDFRHSILS